ncbi:MAG: hypothetical protein QG671_833 [Actinomycetota bacterium]|nr:hypothetical protein [Actinomycetota bacterium]
MSQQVDDRPVTPARPPEPGRTAVAFLKKVMSRLRALLVVVFDVIREWAVRGAKAGWQALRTGAPKLVASVRRHPRRAVVAVAALAAGYLLSVAVGSDSTPAGTTVMGVDVGSLSRQEAQSRLSSEWQRISGEQIAVEAAGTQAMLPRSLVNLNVEATVDRASTNRWLPWDLPRAIFGGGEVAAIGTVDNAPMAAALEDLQLRSEQTLAEPAVVFDGTNPVVRPGRPGAEIDQESAAVAVRDAVLSGQESVQLQTTPVAPTMADDTAADIAANEAKQAVSGPVVFRVGDNTLTASPADIAAVLSYQATDEQLVAQVDGTALLERIGNQLPGLQPTKDAEYTVVDGNPQMTPSQDGRRIAPEQIGRGLIDVLAKSGDERSVTVDLTELKPDYSASQAPGVSTPDMLASFTQKFEPAEYRTINIGGASKRIDGKVLQPGEVFSMNDTVGERTEENGFTKGLVVGEGSQLVPSMGGGVSTATTAIWTAAFFAGLERVEQEAHTLYIPRYTPGLEATVVWDRLDLKFRNDTDQPILIRSSMTDDSINVTIYGTKRFDRIESKISDSRFRGTSATCRSASGGPFDVSVDRIFIKDGVPVNSQNFVTHYVASLGVKCD